VNSAPRCLSRSTEIPTANRFFAAVAVLLATTAASAEPILLDRDRVVALAREQSPEAAISKARTEEARALRTGAGAWAPFNPELSIAAGPRYLRGETKPDFFVNLQWPFDLSGAPSTRSRLADEQVRAAEAEETDAQRRRIGDALDVWLQALSAEGRMALDAHRVELDRAVLDAARVRRKAGAVGDGDVAVATVLAAEAEARWHRSQGERDARLAQLRARLGLPSVASVTLQDQPAANEAPPLPSLLQNLERRPDLVRAALSLQASGTNAELQRRAGWPIPKLSVGGGQEPERVLRFGLAVPLPVYQRNQTAAAESSAKVRTGAAEQHALRDRAEGELHAAYAQLEASRAAAQVLEAAVPAVDDAEHLATRAYELGQGALADLLAARREAADARALLLDSRMALRQARLSLDFASGALP
jgi:cobalt-zinc-cadmium efflux system outer membrane protein